MRPEGQKTGFFTSIGCNIQHINQKNFFHLRPIDYSLDKQWYIFYHQDGQRIKKYGRLNSLPTIRERIQEAERLIEELTKQLDRVEVTDRQKKYLFLEAEKERKKRRLKTYSCLKSKVNMFWLWMDNNSKRKVIEKNVKAFFDQLQKTKHPVTYNRYFTKMRSICILIEKQSFDSCRPYRVI